MSSNITDNNALYNTSNNNHEQQKEELKKLVQIFLHIIDSMNNKIEDDNINTALQNIFQAYKKDIDLNREAKSLDEFFIPTLLKNTCNKMNDNSLCDKYTEYLRSNKNGFGANNLERFQNKLIDQINELKITFKNLNERELFIEKIKQTLTKSKYEFENSDFDKLINTLDEEIKILESQSPQTLNE